MKEIGEKLKEARESIGISIEEASEDLKVLPSQVEAIEIGDMETFKDVFSVKYFIREYAKYLGLSYEDMVDEFNEYLFDYTSKLSIDDIKKAKKEIKTEKPKISSPYTIEYKEKKHIPKFVFIILLILLLVIVIYFIANLLRKDNKNDQPSIGYYVD